MQFLTLNNIQYDANDPGREDYVESGRGSVNGTSVDNVIVFRVDYDVKAYLRTDMPGDIARVITVTGK